MEVPYKRSNYGNIDESPERFRQYIVSLDRDVKNLFDYISQFPKTYIQNTEPSIPRNSIAFWADVTTTNIYLIKNVGGNQVKVQLS